MLKMIISSDMHSGYVYMEDNEASYAGGKTVEVLGGGLSRFSFITALMLCRTKLPGPCVKEASFVEDEMRFSSFNIKAFIYLLAIITLLI